MKRTLLHKAVSWSAYRLAPYIHSDELYIKLKFWGLMGYPLDLNNPQTFNAKLQWLKLFDRKPLYTTMVDKYAVRDYIAKTIGEEYLIPLLGVWDSPEDIDFDALPNQFVLKCNHDSGGLVICKDKSKLDIPATKAKLTEALKHDYFMFNREWPYKNVKQKIIAEQYMEDAASPDLRDYKFYCFNGQPRFLYISEGLGNHATASIDFVTLDWEKAPFTRSDFHHFDTLPAKPEHFNTMLALAEKLSEQIPFLRVDLYEINGKIYFSELTFSPASGFCPLDPPQRDTTLGRYLTLPQKP